jgi:hypothetical protein
MEPVNGKGSMANVVSMVSMVQLPPFLVAYFRSSIWEKRM